MTTAVETVKSLKAQVEAMQKEIKAKSKDAFKEGTKALFDAFPILDGFSWTQYSPYFNDGDECVFSAHTGLDDMFYRFRNFVPTEDDVEDEYEGYIAVGEGVYDVSGYSIGRYEYKTINGTSRYTFVPASGREAEFEAASAVADFMSVFDDGLLQSLYGNHVRVTVLRGGEVEVDDYSHD